MGDTDVEFFPAWITLASYGGAVGLCLCIKLGPFWLSPSSPPVACASLPQAHVLELRCVTSTHTLVDDIPASTTHCTVPDM